MLIYTFIHKIISVMMQDIFIFIDSTSVMLTWNEPKYLCKSTESKQ